MHRAPAAFLQRSELNSRSSDHVKRESGSNLDLSTDHALPPHVLSENKGGDSEWEGGWEVTPGAPIPLWNSQGWIGGYSEVYTPPCFGV